MTSIPGRIAAAQSSIENVRHHTDFATMCRVLMEAKGSSETAAGLAERSGASRVAGVLKSAVDPGSLSSLADYRLMASGFANALQNHGLFDACLPSMRRIPLATSTVGAITTAAVAGISEERGVKPITKLTIENGSLRRSKPRRLLRSLTSYCAQHPTRHSN